MSVLLPKKLRHRTRVPLANTGVTGVIKFHDGSTNLDFVNRLLREDPYFTFGITEVHLAIREAKLSEVEIVRIMAKSLGITASRFRDDGPAYIDPELTVSRLEQALDLVLEAIQKHHLILLATGHPGSMLAAYVKLAEYIEESGGEICVTPSPVAISGSRWIDVVQKVHVMSDRGSLYHSHESSDFWKFLDSINQKPTLVIADHGFAGAAINHNVATIGFHDVDDYGICVAAHLGLNVLPVPMNDNQLNIPTRQAVKAVIGAYRQWQS